MPETTPTRRDAAIVALLHRLRDLAADLDEHPSDLLGDVYALVGDLSDVDPLGALGAVIDEVQHHGARAAMVSASVRDLDPDAADAFRRAVEDRRDAATDDPDEVEDLAALDAEADAVAAELLDQDDR